MYRVERLCCCCVFSITWHGYLINTSSIQFNSVLSDSENIYARKDIVEWFLNVSI